MKSILAIIFILAAIWPVYETQAAARPNVQKQSFEKWARLRIMTQAQVPHRFTLPGVFVSSTQVLALVPAEVSFQDVISGQTVCLDSARCVPLRPLQVDVKNRWIWFESTQKFKVTMKTGFKPVKIRLPASSIGIGSSREMARLVEADIQQWSQQFYQAFLKEKTLLSLGGASFGPRLNPLSCAPSTSVISDEGFQKMIFAGSSMECKTEKSAAISASFDYGFTTKFGYLDLWANRVLSESQRGKLLEELGHSEMENLKQQSAHVQQSTHVVCDSAFLKDEDIEAQFCTRTIRTLPGLQDSVVILGRRQNQRFYYNIVRLSGFNQELTKRFADKLITFMGRHP